MTKKIEVFVKTNESCNMDSQWSEFVDMKRKGFKELGIDDEQINQLHPFVYDFNILITRSDAIPKNMVIITIGKEVKKFEDFEAADVNKTQMYIIDALTEKEDV